MWADPQAKCRCCGEYHPVGVLEDGFCPACCDEDGTCRTCGAREGTPEYGTVGDGFDGECPSCADKTAESEES